VRSPPEPQLRVVDVDRHGVVDDLAMGLELGHVVDAVHRGQLGLANRETATLALARVGQRLRFLEELLRGFRSSSPEYVRLNPRYAMARSGSKRSACWNDRDASIHTYDSR
jgi:hypothetical protein